MFSSFGKDKNSKNQKAAGTAEQAKLDLDRAAAAKTIVEQQAKIKKPMEQMHAVANNQYWRYGYMGGTLLTAGAATFAISARFPMFASVGSLASLGAGFIGGPKLHDMHVMVLKAGVVKQLDDSIAVLEEGDRTHGARCPAYLEELQTLRRMREEILPAGMSIAGHQDAEAAQKAVDLDGRVDEFLVAYERRRGSLPASEGKV